MKNIFYIFYSVCLFCLTGCQTNPANKTVSNPLVGAWEVQSVTWLSDEKTQKIKSAQPGMFIFSESHYALMWSPKQSPRTPFENLSQPTDAEILKGFRSIVFNAGSYYIDGEKLIATAHVAKVPGFEGGQLFYRYELKAGVLLLTMYDETYPNGSKPDWSGKWQTQFTLSKAQ